MPFLGLLRQRATILAAAVLAILLPLLAILQYRWIGEVSQAERERLRAAPDHFAEDFDRELTRAFLSFQPGLSAQGAPGKTAETASAERRATLVRQARRWRIEAPVPQLLRALYIVEEGTGGALALSRLDATGERFVPVPWPADLTGLQKRLAADGPVPPIDGEDAVLVLPLSHTFIMDEAGEGRGRVLLQLDREFITGSFLPSLAERWFQVSNEPQALVAVRSPQGIIYRSDHSVPSAQFLPGDMTIPMFGLRRIESLHGLVPGGFQPGGGGPSGSGPNTGPKTGPNAGRESSPPPRFHPTGPRHHGMGGGSWTLVVTHPAGSLEAAVAHASRRNLAVSFGAIALVAASLVVMALSVQRARLLARQQLELVAGITHELNTPLAAIRSAGQNLADGVVAEGGQVRRYGALIEREGARLSGMVGKALELAGIQSGHRAYRPEAVAVADVVAEALEDGRFLFAEHQIEVDSRIAPDLPAVWADREALRMALVNLLDNAVKYAGSGRFIAVRAALERGGRQVSLTVEDRGPGIRAEDRRHLFEPFYRGRSVAETGVPGSGLGLSLVRRIAESQRGTVSFAAGAGGKGSAFTLHLPAAPQAREAGTADTAGNTESPMGEAL
jgi:signal transduction histidine kinase